MGRGQLEDLVESLYDECHAYQNVCAQLYQILGFLLDEAGRFETESAKQALDLASEAANGEPPDEDYNILPWPKDET